MFTRQAISNPPTEQTYLKVTNDGSIFANFGELIIAGGWIRPTTYSVGNHIHVAVIHQKWHGQSDIFICRLSVGIRELLAERPKLSRVSKKRREAVISAAVRIYEIS